MLFPLKFPGIQLYVEAPFVLIVADVPIQIAGDEVVAVTVGRGLIVTFTKSVLPEQAFVLFVTIS